MDRSGRERLGCVLGTGRCGRASPSHLVDRAVYGVLGVGMSFVRDDTPIPVDARHALVVERERPGRMGASGAWTQWWLLREGVPVGFVRTLTYVPGSRSGHELVLCDIEIRDGYRQQGLAQILVRAIRDQTGQTVWTSGSFTPLGAQALGFLPVLPGETAGVKFRDMTFVVNWDELNA